MTNSMNDQQFGELKWEPAFQWWIGSAELSDGSKADLRVSTFGSPDGSITQQARNAFITIIGSDKQMRKKACDELLNVYNQYWGKGEPISKNRFMERLKLDSIVIYADGSADICFDDGGMFLGHIVMVSMTERGEFVKGNIAG